MAREYLRFVKETGAYGTVITTDPVVTGGIIQLTDSNQFTVRPVPLTWEIRSAGGHARRVMRGSSKMMISGSLNNLIVYASQVPLIKEMLTPDHLTWVLPSYTVDHAIIMEDGSSTLTGRRYTGMTVSKATFSCTSDSQLMRLNLDFIGQSFVVETSFTAPAFADPPVTSGTALLTYPGQTVPGLAADLPVVLEHASAITFHGSGTSSRTEFDNFNLTVTHKLDPTFFNSTRITRLKHCSRDVDGSVTFPYVLVADRADFEGTSSSAFQKITSSVQFAAGTTPYAYVLKFDLNTNGYITGINDNLNYNKLFLQGLTFASYFDASVGSGDATADLIITGTCA